MARSFSSKKKALTSLQRLPPTWPKSGWENRERRAARIFSSHGSYGRKRKQLYPCVRNQGLSDRHRWSRSRIRYPREIDSLARIEKKQDSGKCKLKLQPVVIWADAWYCRLGLSCELNRSTPEECQRPCAYKQRKLAHLCHCPAEWWPGPACCLRAGRGEGGDTRAGSCSLCPALSGPLCQRLAGQEQRTAMLNSHFAPQSEGGREGGRAGTGGRQSRACAAPGRHTHPTCWKRCPRRYPGIWNLSQPDSCSLLWRQERTEVGRKVEISGPLYFANMSVQISSTSRVSQKKQDSVEHTLETSCFASGSPGLACFGHTALTKVLETAHAPAPIYVSYLHF